MKKKNFKKLIFDSLDGEASLEEELSLEKECQINQSLAKEKKSYQEIISLLQKSDKITLPPGFTEKVMVQIEKKPVFLKQKIYRWILSPLNVHLTWAWKWSMAFALVFLIWAGVNLHYSRWRQLQTQVGQLEQQITTLKDQPVPTRFVFQSSMAKSVHLAGTFNNWQTKEQYRLVNVSGSGIWSITLMLEPGKYEYMFLVNEKEWVTDPGAMDFYSDGFGHKNSIVEVWRDI